MAGGAFCFIDMPKLTISQLCIITAQRPEKAPKTDWRCQSSFLMGHTEPAMADEYQKRQIIHSSQFISKTHHFAGR
jgi:hypothetical protein